MHKKLACSLLGAALLLAPIAVSAQTTSTASSLIATLEALVQTLEQELQQLIAAHSGATATTATTATTQQPTTSTTSSTNLCATYASLTQGDTDATTNGEVSQLQSYVGISPTTGYYGAQTSIAYQNKCGNLGNAQPTSVAGMSEYTDSNFGFSFWYPSGWSVAKTQTPDANLENVTGNYCWTGTTLASSITVSDGTRSVLLDEYISPSGITYSCDGADDRTYFDSSAGEWMYENKWTGGDTKGASDPQYNTMGGLHNFGSFVALSAQNFVVVGSTNDANADLANLLMQTIVATNPAVAIPLSTVQQTAAIQAEADGFGDLPSGTIDQNSLTTTTASPNPIITGEANTQYVEVIIRAGDYEYTSGLNGTVPVTNGQWSATFAGPIPAGSYDVEVDGSSYQSGVGGTQIATGTLTVTSPSTVAGMSEYTDSNFGFSFWYPSGWTISAVPVQSSSFSGGTVVKQLQVTSTQGKSIQIEEVDFPSASITTGDAGCDAAYAFNPASNGWTQTVIGCDGATNIPEPYSPSGEMTMGGLIIFASQEGLSTVYQVVPLSWSSAQKSLVVTGETTGASTGIGRGQEMPLVDTIMSTNPSAATPQSPSQQSATIQAEASAYAGQ